MGKIVGIATLVVGGIILADLLTHPQGTATLSQGITNLVGGAGNQLLGVKTSSGRG